MKKVKYILLPLLVIVIITASCKKDFLEETVYSSYSPSTLRDALGFGGSLIGL